jgi:hypothetical protein
MMRMRRQRKRRRGEGEGGEGKLDSTITQYFVKNLTIIMCTKISILWFMNFENISLIRLRLV